MSQQWPGQREEFPQVQQAQPMPAPRQQPGRPMSLPPIPNPRQERMDAATIESQRAAQEATQARLGMEAERLRLAQEEAARKAANAQPGGLAGIEGLVQEEMAKATAKKQADIRLSLPNLEETIGGGVQRIDSLLSDPQTLSSIFGLPTLGGAARGGLGMVGSVPGTRAADAATSFDALSGIVRTQAFESLKGGGQITEKESQFAADARANLSRAQSPQAAERELRRLRVVLQNGMIRARQSAGLLPDDVPITELGGVDLADANALETYLSGANQAPDREDGVPAFNFRDAGGRPSPQMQFATGGDLGNMRSERNPELAGVETEYRRMLFGDRPAAEILQFLRQRGATAQQLRDARAQIEYRRRNPNVGRDQYDTSGIEMRQVPVSDVQRAVGAALEATGGLGAGLVTAGDSMLAQNTARFASDPEGFREAMAGLREEYPISTFVGDVAGGTAGTLGLGKILGAAGVAPRAGLTADVVFGGATGYGMGGEDAGLGDLAAGAAFGGAGSLAARGGANVVRELRTPSGGSAQAVRLDRAGVTGMTPGQRFGGLINTLEEAAGTIPIAGAPVRSAREVPRESFQRAAFREALAPLGVKIPENAKPGPALFRFAEGKFDDAFRRAERGMVFEADQAFVDDFNLFQADLMSEAFSKSDRAAVGRVINDVFGGRVDPTGNIDLGNARLQGPALQSTMKDLAAARRKLSPSRSPAAAKLREFEQLVQDAAARNPNTSPEALKLYGDARQAFRNYAVVRAAADTNTQTFGPDDLLAAARGQDTSSQQNRFLQGLAPMQDLASAGRTLENQAFPDAPVGRVQSGAGGVTRGQAGTGLSVGLGALGYTAGPVAATVAAPIAAYLPGARNYLSQALTPRHSAAVRSRSRRRGRQQAPAIGAAGAATTTASNTPRERED